MTVTTAEETNSPINSASGSVDQNGAVEMVNAVARGEDGTHEGEAVTTVEETDSPINSASGSVEQNGAVEMVNAVARGEDGTHEAPPPVASSVDASTSPPRYRWYYPKNCKGEPAYHGNQEALAFLLDSIGRSVAFIGSGAFLGTALLTLAKVDAGCATEPPPGSDEIPDCDKRVYGIRPGSLLTTYTMIVGIVSATLMPLMGAIVDYTPHRLRVGRWTSVFFCLLLLPQIAISEETWFAVAILQVFVAFVGWAQTMVTYAFLPELTPIEERLNQYTQSFTVFSFGSMVLYLAVIVGIVEVAGFGDDDVASARLGMSVAFAVNSIVLYLAWGRLFRPRPAAHVLPPDSSLWTAGFIQVYHTSVRICKNYRALKWFYVSVSFVDAGVNALATIAITVLTDTLGFSSQENAIAILLMLIGSIPGAVAAGQSNRRFNPIYSSIMATLILAVNCIAAGIVLTGPGQQVETYILAVIWGVGTGWKWTTDRLMASVLIPDGQDAELMGVYLFAGQILTWLPPLVFTILNEAGVSQRIGIGSLSIYFLLGMVALFLMGSYKEAVAVAGRLGSTAEVDGTTDRISAHAQDGQVDNANNTIGSVEEHGKAVDDAPSVPRTEEETSVPE